ncbi:MAG: protein kinase [Acidiferrobacterales bacterium]
MTGYHKDALPHGYQLAEYVIESVLGHGGFGVTYLAKDSQLGTQVAIKEYLPHDIARRTGATNIVPNPEDETVVTYQCGLKEFLKEGQALARFKHANIVRVLRFIEAHGTAYMVMEYEKGKSLAQYLKRTGPRLDPSSLLRIFLPIMNGLNAVHEAGMLHLDIKPENIYLREDGNPMLIDFGSARQALIGPGHGQVVALTPGYAPIEQYPDNGKPGPWTDVYALGASLHRCISGKRPIASPERQQASLKYKPDPLPPAATVGRDDYPAYILECIDWALRVHASERPKTVRELQDALMGKGGVNRRAQAPAAKAAFKPGRPTSNSVPPRGLTQSRRPKGRSRRGSGKRWLVAAMLIAAVGATTVFYGPQLEARLPGLMAYWQNLSNGKRVLYKSSTSNTKTKKAKKSRSETADTGRNTKKISKPSSQTQVVTATESESRRSPEPPVASRRAESVLPSGLARTLTGHDDWVHAVAFSPDGKTLASASYDRTIRLWNVATGTLHRILRGHDRGINSVAYSTDGKWLASAGDDGTVRLWDASTGRPWGLFEGPGYAVYTVAFSPNGTQLAAGGKDRSVFVWNVSNGELLYTLDGHRDDIQAVAFSTDGRTLASGGADKTVRLWDLGSGSGLATLVGHKDVVLSLAFSPDRRWLVSGGSKKIIKLWNAHSGQLIRTFPRVRHAVLSLAFSPDGQWLATGGGNLVKLWNAESASVEKTLKGHKGYVQAVAFSPDGTTLASASRDHTVKIWTAR